MECPRTLVRIFQGGTDERIQDAYHHDTGGFRGRPKASLIVAYCGGPQCEAWCMAADKLETMGYTNIRHYKGGIKEWKQAGLETASAKSKG